MTDPELKQLAIDFVEGRVFTDRHIPPGAPPDVIGMVFMPLMLMKEEDLVVLKQEAPAMIYEYVDKAGPTAINGMPSFFSFRTLSKADTETLFTYVRDLEAQKEFDFFRNLVGR